MDTRWLCAGLLATLTACPQVEVPSESGTSTEDNTGTHSSGSSTEADAGSDSSADGWADEGTAGGGPRPERLVVTADWREKRLSLVDYGALLAGAPTRAHALWKTIELDAYEPGPIELALTPDGTRAVVSVGPGPLGGPQGALIGVAPGSLPEGGAVLIVDLDAGTVLAELETPHAPLGIVVEPSGARAWTANYGSHAELGHTVSRIDLQTLEIDHFETDLGPQQLDLDGAGQRLMLTCGGYGTYGTLATAFLDDPADGLLAMEVLNQRPGWAFFLDDPDSHAAAISTLNRAFNPVGYLILDVYNPYNPYVVATHSSPGTLYAGARGFEPGELILAALVGSGVELRRYRLGSGSLVDSLEIPASGYPLGLRVVPEDQVVLVPLPGANALAVASFAEKSVHTIPWQELPGPTHLALE